MKSQKTKKINHLLSILSLLLSAWTTVEGCVWLIIKTKMNATWCKVRFYQIYRQLSLYLLTVETIYINTFFPWQPDSHQEVSHLWPYMNLLHNVFMRDLCTSSLSPPLWRSLPEIRNLLSLFTRHSFVLWTLLTL